MVIVRSPASATVINAISTGKGSAFGIELYVTAEVTVMYNESVKSVEYICKSLDHPNMDTRLMEESAKRAYDKLNENPLFNLENICIIVETTSDIPPGSGLSSSSAASNSVVYATLLALIDECGLNRDAFNITDEDIINMAIDASLEVGVTKTGSYDDASASFYGGWKITDNYEREILHEYRVEYEKVLIYIPNKSLYTAKSDVNAMKSISSLVEIAFNKAIEKNIEDALTLNGFLYCAALDLDSQISMKAIKAGAKAAGLSGTGSAYTILANPEDMESIKDALRDYPGRLIECRPDNTGSIVL